MTKALTTIPTIPHRHNCTVIEAHATKAPTDNSSLYTFIVGPMLTYVAVVWWPRVGRAMVRADLGRLQGLACVSIMPIKY
jgi:hypothetical protein